MRLNYDAKSTINPWDLAFLPNGWMLATEQAGRLKAKRSRKLIEGIPPVAAVKGGYAGQVGRGMNLTGRLSHDHERPEALAEVKKGRMDVDVTTGEEPKRWSKISSILRLRSSSARRRMLAQ